MAVSAAEIERRMKQLLETCRRSGMKFTRRRTEVSREVAGIDEHPGAETVVQQAPKGVTGRSRYAVYRTLSTMAAQTLKC